MHIFRSLSLAALCAWAGWAQGQSLLDAAHSALAYDAAWQAQGFAYDAATHRQAQARAGLLPQVGLQASTQHSDNTVRVQTPMGEQTSTLPAWQRSAGVQLTQPLYRPANLAQYRQGQAGVAQAAAQQTAAQQQLLVQVAQAYFALLQAQDNLRVQTAWQQALAQQAARAQRNFDVGVVTITDVREAQARLDGAQAQEIAARNDVTISTLALQKLTNWAQPQPWQLPPQAQLPVASAQELQDWQAHLADTHPQVQQAEQARAIAALEVRKAQAGHLPTVDLAASYGQQRNPDGSLTMTAPHRVTVGTVGVQLQLPLFAGFAVQNRLREALSQQAQADAQLEEARRSATLAMNQAYWAVQSAQQQTTALTAAVESNRTALEATEKAYAVGVRINADVLNAQAQFYQAQKELLRARYQLALGQLQLRQAAGRWMWTTLPAPAPCCKHLPARTQPSPALNTF